MRIWDNVKKAWSEVRDSLPKFDIETGKFLGKLSDDEEIRHEPSYDSQTGIESMKPVVRKKSEVYSHS